MQNVGKWNAEHEEYEKWSRKGMKWGNKKEGDEDRYARAVN